MVKTPVAYIIFNRPQHTEQTFAILHKHQPSQLFIIADGPRPGHPTDIGRCARVREIVEKIDWPCDVHRHYSEANLGLKQRVSSGLSWVFENVDRAIVLEDDCLAHPDFFVFCDDLLERYADDNRVSVITGNNFQNGQKRGVGTYYFSKYNHCWGWATWRRAWKFYEGNIPFWSEWSQSYDWIEKTPDPVERKYWTKIFNRVQAGEFDSWAYPWTASLWYRGGLTATPNVNLVSNIGFGSESTHTSSANIQQSEMKFESIGIIKHPFTLEQDVNADRYVFDHIFGGRYKRFPYYILWRIRRVFDKILKITKVVLFRT